MQDAIIVHFHTNVGDVHYNCQGHAAVDRQVGNTAWLATNSSPQAHNIPTYMYVRVHCCAGVMDVYVGGQQPKQVTTVPSNVLMSSFQVTS